MNLYYFTFGQQYRTEPHPQSGHPDGWFTIEAPDEDAARDRMVKLCGQQWATSYENEPSLSAFPRGELRKIEWSEFIPERTHV